jgi:hypothetical protein
MAGIGVPKASERRISRGVLIDPVVELDRGHIMEKYAITHSNFDKSAQPIRTLLPQPKRRQVIHARAYSRVD